MAKRLFTSESVTEGHPDKICDQISDAVLDAILEQDPMGRVACETTVSTGLVHIMGEITTSCYVDIPKIAREVIRDMDLRYLLTETDAPYVTPEPFRGQRNEPCNLPYILRSLASYRGMAEEELAEIIVRNYRCFLGEDA